MLQRRPHHISVPSRCHCATSGLTNDGVSLSTALNKGQNAVGYIDGGDRRVVKSSNDKTIITTARPNDRIDRNEMREHDGVVFD